MNNLKKFTKIVSNEHSNWLEKANARKDNEEWMDDSFNVASLVLRALRRNKMHQSDLAKLMGVTPQHINKIVKGQENLSLSTIKKLEKALDIKIISILINQPTANYSMNVSAGSMTIGFIIKGRKSEESYANVLNDAGNKTSLTMYVRTSTNENEITISEGCLQGN